jgi:hypothetical protein
MGTVGAEETQDCLTRYLRRTNQSEELTRMERGNPIALIQPIKSPKKSVNLEAKAR